jgi:two-component system cell cycle sensor histidine kinase/response regulator CckA
MPHVTEQRLPRRPRSEGERQRRVLQVSKVVSAIVGADFFRSLTEHLARALGGDCVYIAELVDGRRPKVRTVAVYRDGQAADDFEQDLSGSSADQVLTDGSLAWSKEVRRIFPADTILEALSAEGYAGVRLNDSEGQVIGLIALIAKDRLQNLGVVKSVLGAFAARAAAELERKRDEDALRESEQRYRAFIAQSTDAMWRIELATPIPLSAPEEEQIERIYRDGYLAECNDAMAQLAGARNVEELIGTQFSAIFEESDTRIREELRAAIRNRHRSATIITTPVGPDGRTLYRLRTQCGIVENDELRRIWGTTRDVTELKMAELAVEASERRFREVLENIHLPALMLDESGAVTFANDALLRIANSTASLLGLNWLGVIQEPCERDTWAALLSEKFAATGSQFHFEGALRLGGAAPRLLVWDAIVLRNVSGEGIGLAAIGRDITDQRLLESRLAKAEKLEGIGRLAAGIAHDFNNFLTLIMGHVEFGVERLDSDSPLRKTLGAIQAAANDCAVLTQQLLAIGARQHLRPELLSLNSVIEGEEVTIQRIMGPDVEYVKNLEPFIGFVWADPVQIRRIITNLATNSRDAMPNGGTFTIATANVEIAANAAAFRTDAPPGDYVRISVTDTGPGLSDEVKQHLFEPFVTTKPAGKGTGLGLTTVYGIVSQSGGHISFCSAGSGTGTTVDILLPRFKHGPPGAEKFGS